MEFREWFERTLRKRTKPGRAEPIEHRPSCGGRNGYDILEKRALVKEVKQALREIKETL